MITKSILRLPTGNPGLGFLALASSLLGILPALAQTGPTIVSTVPANMASGVSPTASVVFTFSTAMDTNATYPVFFDTSSPFAPLLTDDSWSADSKVLTCKPMPAFPGPNKMIAWSMNGFDLAFDPLEGNTSGFFTTGSGGNASGSGTNKITSFSVAKVFSYDQTSTLAPFPDSDMAYSFIGSTELASNRTALSINLTLPTAVVANLTENMFHPESFYTFDGSTNQAAFDAQYPSGNYVFNVQAATSNQQVTVNLPSTLTQPPAPHLSNFTAAQAVDPTKPFTLTWDAFAGGTAADFISVQIETNFTTADFNAPGALPGTATSVTIPANTLPPSRFLSSCYVTFHHFLVTSNSSYVTFAYRASSTRFFLTTTAGSSTGSSPLVLTNALGANGAGFTFDITSPPGQTITVEYSTTLQAGSWSPLITTNSSTGRVTITDPQLPGASARFYRARQGN